MSSNQDDFDASRRLFRRFEIGLNVDVQVGKEIFAGKIYDISFGGAKIEPGNEQWIGQDITLRNGELGDGTALDGKVIGVDGNRSHIRFGLSPKGEEQLTFVLMCNA